MKKLIKTFAVLAAVAALSFGVTSCSSDSSDSNSNLAALIALQNAQNGTTGTTTPTTTTPATQGALAIFTYTAGTEIRTLTFNSDSSFKAIVNDGEIQAVGTYTFDSGDWENGSVTLTATTGTKTDRFAGTKTIAGKKLMISSKEYTLTGGTKVTPAATATKTDTTKTDTTKTDTTKTDTTKTDTTKTDATKTDTTKTDATATSSQWKIMYNGKQIGDGITDKDFEMIKKEGFGNFKEGTDYTIDTANKIVTIINATLAKEAEQMSKK